MKLDKYIVAHADNGANSRILRLNVLKDGYSYSDYLECFRYCNPHEVCKILNESERDK